MAGQVRRYLNYEPLTIRAPSAWYNIRKFARRNKVVVGAALAIFAVLIAGTAVSVTFGVRERRQRSEAERQKTEADRRREESEAVNRFLTQDVLERIGPAYLADKPLRDNLVERMLNPPRSPRV
jgi:hypothetical protein